jgi:hypothetical protein
VKFEQLTTHVTPEFVLSLATTAVTVAVAVGDSEAGGAWVIVTEMAAVTMKVVTALKLWSAVA